jgi:AcrR family transcriptional regulator
VPRQRGRAEEAGVVPTAVYYHFAGKDELFDVALGQVITDVDAVVDAAREAKVDTDEATRLVAVIRAVWDWNDAHPDQARVLYSHLGGATPHARQLRQQFEEQHVERAYEYRRASADRRHRTNTAQHAAARLSVRTLIHLLIAIHPLRFDGGPLSRRSGRGLRTALEDVAVRLTIID